jgi:MATE family multidrug resistance protein
LAVPLVIAQILEAGIPLLDGVMMGLLGNQALAAGALAAITFSTLVNGGVNIISNL